MSKFNLPSILQTTRQAITKHSPEILTGIGIAGMFATVVMAVKATPKALDSISKEEYEQQRELTPMETVKVAWKPYIPAALTGTLSTACLIGANSVNLKRNAALAAAYTLSDTAFREYREKVVETIGEKKEQTVKDKVAEKQVREHPVSNEVTVVGKGPSLCLEPLSMRYFNTDISTIKKAQNDINAQILEGVCGNATVNDFYDALNLPHTDVGDSLGWDLDNRVSVHISAQVTEAGEPCLVIGHDNPPKYLGY